MRKECKINSDSDNIKVLKLYCLNSIFQVIVVESAYCVVQAPLTESKTCLSMNQTF